MIEMYDNLENRCSMLGHQIQFKYCRSLKDNLPCSKILDCWFEMIPIRDFIHAHFTEEEINIFLSPSKPKIVTLVDLIEKAKRANN